MTVNPDGAAVSRSLSHKGRVKAQPCRKNQNGRDEPGHSDNLSRGARLRAHSGNQSRVSQLRATEGAQAKLVCGRSAVCGATPTVACSAGAVVQLATIMRRMSDAVDSRYARFAGRTAWARNLFNIKYNAEWSPGPQFFPNPGYSNNFVFKAQPRVWGVDFNYRF